MKFKDIPQFPRSNYRIDVPWKFLIESLSRYKIDQEKDGYKFELNPDFQRGHVWSETQKVEYVAFILHGGESGKEVYFNHTGWHDNFDADMVCIDGLQRISAVLDFLNDKLKVFGLLYSQFEGNLHFSHNFKFHIMCLSTRQEILEWYLSFNSKGRAHTKKEIGRVRALLNREIEENNAVLVKSSNTTQFLTQLKDEDYKQLIEEIKRK